MNILIATGIYPPDLGGPAKYAYELEMVWKKQGHTVSVVTYHGLGKKLPMGIRHIWFFLQMVRYGFSCDSIFILDTFSAALPAILFAKLFRKRTVLRTGGDFLWEGYVERTRKKVLLRNFYTSELGNLTIKEWFIFECIRFILNACDRVVFSTIWQRDIFLKPYGLESKKTISVIGNYAERPAGTVFYEKRNKTILGNTRSNIWKNIDMLDTAFHKSGLIDRGYELDIQPHSKQDFQKLLEHCKAAVLVSLGDISPNMILEALSVGTPCIVTSEIGIRDILENHVCFVDPMDQNQITQALADLDDKEKYKLLWFKAQSFAYNHSWESIAQTFENLMIR